jgi:hypothetical protein
MKHPWQRWTLWWKNRLRPLVHWFRRKPSHLLPAPSDPPPGTRDFLHHPSDDSPVSDPRTESWITHLRTNLPFPQPLYGASDAPDNARELHERLSALDAEMAAQVAVAATRDGFDAQDPDWFLTLADRFLPLAAWYAGVGVEAGAPELPDRLRDLTDRARRIPGINRALEWLAEQVEQLTRQNVGTMAAWFVLLKIHFEALLRPLAKETTVEVVFEFPAPGARVAELVPPPAPGSATSGTVVRVLCPAVTVRLGNVVFQRGAHVRTR